MKKIFLTNFVFCLCLFSAFANAEDSIKRVQSMIFDKGSSEHDKLLSGQKEEIDALHRKVGQLTIECDWLKKKSDEVFGPQGAHRTRFLR